MRLCRGLALHAYTPVSYTISVVAVGSGRFGSVRFVRWRGFGWVRWTVRGFGSVSVTLRCFGDKTNGRRGSLFALLPQVFVLFRIFFCSQRIFKDVLNLCPVVAGVLFVV